ncbi:MAG: hypothetical protein FJ207_12545 [Gemmatimonadetes bacterium]|nr:hypothetical protein [Gemmatimonadota bacterium]
MTRKDDEALDRYLEGELPLEALPDEERANEVRLRDALGSLKREVSAPAGFRADVMRAIAESDVDHVSLWKRVLSWWINPQPIRVRPALGALALATVVALVFVVRPDVQPSGAQVATSGEAQPVTRFVFVAPEAASVRLTGDFVSWSPEGIALEDPRGTGVWTTDVALPPGVYQYTFVVNGTEWVPDPRAVSQVDDGFGQLNSVVIVPAEGEA